jgi:hypothetical protein
MNFTKLNLDKSAIGFFIDVTQNENFVATNGRTNWTTDNTYPAPQFWYWGKVECIFTNNVSPDIRAEWFYKNSNWGSWNAAYWVFIAPYAIDTYNNPSTKYIRVKVYSNWSNYRVYFRKYSSDAWILQ